MKTACLLLALALLASALTDVPPGWQQLDEAPMAHAAMPVRLLLKHNNADKLDELFWAVSDPTHERYADYHSRQQLGALLGSTDEQLAPVWAWLHAASVPRSAVTLLPTRDAMLLQLTVASAEALLHVRYAVWRHTPTGRTVYRSADAPQLPAAVADRVELLLGVNNWPFPSSRRRRALRSATPQPAAASPSPSAAPVPQLSAFAGTSSATFAFPAVCMDGKVTANATAPCADHPPALTSANVTWTTSGGGGGSGHGGSDAAMPISCSSRAGSVTCSFSLPAQPFVSIASLALQLNYAGGEVSGLAQAQFPALVSPAISPATLRQLYNIPTGTRVTNSKTTQAVAEFEQQYFSRADLSAYLVANGLPDAAADVRVVGPNNGSMPGGEASLDIQLLMGVAPGAKTTFWSIAAVPANTTLDNLLEWAMAMSADSKAPLLTSISYGMPEDLVDAFNGKGYLARSNAEFKKLALAGHTILIACGDTGAGDLGPAADGEEATCSTRLHADWPSTSAYVTAIGATVLTPRSEPLCYLPPSAGGIDCHAQPPGEVAVSLQDGIFWTTGGGFADYTSRPSYQDKAVKAYLAAGAGTLPPASFFNSKGRVLPDGAAVGHNLWCVIGGDWQTVDGTSAAAPIFAAVLTLVNDALLNGGGKPLGFANPLLYKLAQEHPAAFNDVTVGYNACGAYGGSPLCCPAGYRAAPGFDAVSGLGSPNYQEMLAGIAALTAKQKATVLGISNVSPAMIVVFVMVAVVALAVAFVLYRQDQRLEDVHDDSARYVSMEEDAVTGVQ